MDSPKMLMKLYVPLKENSIWYLDSSEKNEKKKWILNLRECVNVLWDGERE